MVVLPNGKNKAGWFVAWSFYFQYVHRIITHTANHDCKTWGLSGVNISMTALLGANICHYFDPCLIKKVQSKSCKKLKRVHVLEKELTR